MKEPLGTQVEPGLGRRLRVYAAVNRRNIAEVVAAALDSYLPLLADLVREADDAHDNGPGASDAGAVQSLPLDGGKNSDTQL